MQLGSFSPNKETLIIFPPAKKEPTSYSIPSEVTTINSYAFYKCSIVFLTISDQVKITTIQPYTFAKSSLQTIKIYASITLIDQYAFSECSQLATFLFPSTIARIEYYAFSKCRFLGQIILPDPTTNNKVKTPGSIYYDPNGGVTGKTTDTVIQSYGYICYGWFDSSNNAKVNDCGKQYDIVSNCDKGIYIDISSTKQYSYTAVTLPEVYKPDINDSLKAYFNTNDTTISIRPIDFSKTSHFKFLGWYLNDQYKGVAGESFTPSSLSSKVELIAHWEISYEIETITLPQPYVTVKSDEYKYTVSYNLNGFDGNIPNDEITKEVTSVFNGWYLSNSDDSLIGNDGDTYTPPEDTENNIIIYAHWNKESAIYPITLPSPPLISISESEEFNVSYDLNGAKGTLPDDLVTKTILHTFNGWYLTDKGGSPIGEPSGSYLPSEISDDLVIYAQWLTEKPIYSSYRLPLPQHHNSSYLFLCWNENKYGNGMSYRAESPFSTTESITLYAQWIKMTEEFQPYRFASTLVIMKFYLFTIYLLGA